MFLLPLSINLRIDPMRRCGFLHERRKSNSDHSRHRIVKILKKLTNNAKSKRMSHDLEERIESDR
jgi:hypothetical protein